MPGGSPTADPRHPRHAIRWASPIAALAFSWGGALGGTNADPSARLSSAMDRAETQLRAGDVKAAEDSYRQVLFDGWTLKGELERLGKNFEGARSAFSNAAPFAAGVEEKRSLAASWLQLRDGPKAVELLDGIQKHDATDFPTVQMLVRALEVSGQNDRAEKALASFLATAPDDPEALYAVGAEYLGLARRDEAKSLFERLVSMRPVAATKVLLGRTYLGAGLYEDARKVLLEALAQDRGAHHAHYYLGAAIESDSALGPDRGGAAIAEYEEELALDPGDRAASDRLGVALLDAGRAEEAQKALQNAVHGEKTAVSLYHLGRCQLTLGRVAEAVATLKGALAAAEAEDLPEAETEKMHYQLGLAERKAGNPDEASAQLAEAKRIAERWNETAGNGMGGETRDPTLAGRATAVAALLRQSEASHLSPAQREELLPIVKVAIARAYTNLGTIRAQGGSLSQAAALFEEAVAVAPGFADAQYSLGVTRFNLGEHDRATGPLSLAVASRPQDAELKRMLALAWFNSKVYDKAAELLEKDPARASMPALQFTYALALARSGHQAQAVEILESLAAQDLRWPEVTEALRQLKNRGTDR